MDIKTTMENIFGKGGKFKSYLKESGKSKEYVILRKYVGIKRKLLKVSDSYDNDKLSFQKNQIPSFAAAFPSTLKGEFEQAVLQRFVIDLLCLPPETDVVSFMNRSDVNCLAVVSIMNDTVIKVFFEGIPFEKWMEKD